MLRRFAGNINKKNLDLGELNIWYDSADDSSIITDGGGNVTQINNKGTLLNGEMIFTAGGAVYEPNVYNGNNTIRGTSTGMSFRMNNANKADYRYLHQGGFTIYQVLKILTNTNRIMALLGNSLGTTIVGFADWYENRDSINEKNSHNVFIGNTLLGTPINFDRLTDTFLQNQLSIRVIKLNERIVGNNNNNLYKEHNIYQTATWNQNQPVDLGDSENILSIGDSGSTITKLLADLCEIRVYKKTHTDEERINVTNNLINKWGITI